MPRAAAAVRQEAPGAIPANWAGARRRPAKDAHPEASCPAGGEVRPLLGEVPRYSVRVGGPAAAPRQASCLGPSQAEAS